MIKRIENFTDVSLSDFEMPWSLFPFSNYEKYGDRCNDFTLYKIGKTMFAKYYNTVQLCSFLSRENLLEFCNFILKNKIRMITGPFSTLQSIQQQIGDGVLEQGVVFQLKPFLCDSNNIIKMKRKQEFRLAAQIVCGANSVNYSFYTEDEYFKQMYKRFKEKYCRNYAYLINNRIVGHIATYSESSKYCVIGGLAVLPEYRNKGIAKGLLSKIISELNNEGKEVYAFCYNEKLLNFYTQHSINQSIFAKLLFKI